MGERGRGGVGEPSPHPRSRRPSGARDRAARSHRARHPHARRAHRREELLRQRPLPAERRAVAPDQFPLDLPPHTLAISPSRREGIPALRTSPVPIYRRARSAPRRHRVVLAMLAFGCAWLRASLRPRWRCATRVGPCFARATVREALRGGLGLSRLWGSPADLGEHSRGSLLGVLLEGARDETCGRLRAARRWRRHALERGRDEPQHRGG